MKIPKEENGACEERASKQAKQSKAKQVPSASWYWTKDLPGNQRLQRLSRGACVWRPGGSGRVATMDWALVGRHGVLYVLRDQGLRITV
jgi:hypothetical protein